MMRRFLAIAAFAVLQSACGARTPAASALHSDSGVDVPFTADQVAARTVSAIPARWRPLAQEFTYGKSSKGFTLRGIRIADPAVTLPAGKVRPAVLITQAIHGNEFLDI